MNTITTIQSMQTFVYNRNFPFQQLTKMITMMIKMVYNSEYYGIGIRMRRWKLTFGSSISQTMAKCLWLSKLSIHSVGPPPLLPYISLSIDSPNEAKSSKHFHTKFSTKIETMLENGSTPLSIDHLPTVNSQVEQE